VPGGGPADRKGQQAVPEEIHDNAVVAVNNLNHFGEKAVDKADGLFRDQIFGDGGKGPQVRKEDGHLPFFSSYQGGFWPIQELPGDFGVHIASESIADVVPFLEAGHHFIEALGELADFIRAVDRQGFAVIALGHPACGLGDLLNGIYHRSGAQVDQSQDDGKAGEAGQGVVKPEAQDGRQDLVPTGVQNNYPGSVVEMIKSRHPFGRTP
jgi:hypothetical protein